MKKYLLKLTMVLLCAITMIAAFVVPAVAATATVYESNAAMNGNDVFFGSNWRAQTFTPSQTHTITSVQMPFINKGTGAGNVVVSIRATNAGGMPTGADLASGTVTVASVTTAWAPATWYTFNMGTPCTVEADKTYAIVWKAESASTMYYWMNMSSSYAGGRVMSSIGGNSWSNLSVWDAAFRVYGESVTAPPPTTTTTTTPPPTTTTTVPPTTTTTTPPPTTPPTGTVALYENMTSINGNWDVFGTTWRAQTFIPTTSHTITSIQIPLLRRGTAAGDIVVSIRATDASGMPTGADLASGTVPSSSLTTAWTPAVWYTFNLGSGCVVEAGKTYAAIFRAPSASASTGLYYWVNLSGTYAGGQAMTSTGGTNWSTLNVWDTGFRESGISGSTSPPPVTTPPSTTTTPLPTTTTTTTGGVRNTGWISVYFAGNTSLIPWNQLSSLIYQNVYCVSASNPTLLLQGGYSWSQLSNLASQANAHGVPILACLWGGGDPAQNDNSPVLKSIISNPTLKQQLFNNLNALCSQYNLAGIAIDWEGSYPDPQTYAQFLKDMRAALGSKLITPIGSWTEVSINSSAAPYIDWISLMSYDYWVQPWYGTVAMVKQSVDNWINAGWPKNKIDIGIEFKDMSGAWSPVQLIKDKAAWAKSYGLGGAWGYEIGYQSQNNLGQQQAIFDGLGGVVSK